MIIAVDIDEVLADFSNKIDDFVEKKYKIKMDRNLWNTDDWWKTWGGTKTTAVGKIFEFSQSEDFKDLPLIPGAIEGVKALKEMGHELVIITGRPYEWMDVTKKWLNKHFPDTFRQIESTDFHVAKGGHKTKGKLAREMSCDILIDDFPHYAEEAINNGVKVLLFDTGYNHKYNEHDDIIRVKGWEEVVKTVKKLSK